MPVDSSRQSWKPGMDWDRAVDDIHYIRGLAGEMGGPDRIERQHRGGRLTVRERIERFVDPGSFIEAQPLVGAADYDDEGNLKDFTPGGYVMGLGEIDGRPIAIGGDDFTISGGSPHNVHKHPRTFTQPLALQYGIPYVQFVEGVGHSSKADETSGHMVMGSGDQWWPLVELLRTVPVAAGIMGSVAGAPAAYALLSHFTVMVKGQSQIFPSGPPVVRRAIGETYDKETLGGAQVHVHESGQVDNEAESEEEAFDQIKSFLSYLPNTTSEVAPRVETGDPPDRRPEDLLHIIPPNRKHGYDARKLIRLVVDNGEFFEMRRYYGSAVITGFARFDGYSAGVIGSDPMRLAGAMDGDAGDKFAHFLDLCDTFNLPIVILLDMPGFMLGLQSERKASMRRGARAIIAAGEAQVPKVEFIVRKSYGVAADVPHAMSHPHGLNLRFGWPAGEWGGVPIEGGVAAAYRREIDAAPDPEAYREEIEERLLRLRSPFRAAHHGDVTDLIDPRDTRRLACRFVKLAQPMLTRLAERPKRAVRP
jgi:acetyl-CoA carboxylase carboxyltransferase component